MRFLFTGLVLSLGLIVLNCLGDETQGKLVVKVTVEGTGEPVTGAEIAANFGVVQSEEEKTFLPKYLTDKMGRCEVLAPWGNVRLGDLNPPPGFWPATKSSRGINRLQQFVITRQQPVIERPFSVVKGTVWPFKVATPEGMPLPDLEVLVYRSSDQANTALVTDAMGQGKLTLPPDGGKLSVTFNYRRFSFTPRTQASVEIDPNFDPLAIVTQSSVADGSKVELTDKQGHKAVWEGCRIATSGDAVKLIFSADRLPDPAERGEIVGEVIDKNGQPIVGASVRCYASGVDLLKSHSKTDELGLFHFHGLAKTRGSGRSTRTRLIVKKDGFAGIISDHFFVPNADGLHRIEQPIVLQPGRSIRLRVLSEFDQPVEGVWITCSHGASEFGKTDDQGYCSLRDLPDGPATCRFSYGEDVTTQRIVVGPESQSADPIIVRLGRAPDFRQQAKVKEPLPKAAEIGEVAPEWAIREWSDGRERTLTSLRGRVVVIDFWSLTCAPCRQVTLPIENKLQKRFAEDVTFIYIHPAGTEHHLIKELLALEQWGLLVGFDSGPNEAESETLRRYGVRGYPTEVIIDRLGRIAYHSNEGRDDREKRAAAMKATAEEIGLPWPIDKDADQGEITRRLRQYHEHWMTKEIEKTLAQR